jgi:hypothetical protein
MTFKCLRCLCALAGGWLLAAGVQAQPATPTVEFPAASPAGTLKQRVGLTDIEVDYSRPGVKDRQIFGGLVPYGQVWRTGANAATKITFSTDVKLNGKDVPAGTYALFTIPGQDEWTIIINKGSAQWGAFQYDEKADVVRFQATPVELQEQIETFTIEFNHIRDESAIMNLVWDHAVVPIHLSVELTGKLVPQIEAVMASDSKHKASAWVDAAIAQREAYYIVHLKAQILAKLGDKDGAIAAAKHSSELAVKAKDTGYVKLNDDLISSLK